ncbi:MAG: insulinase family protein [Myxococcales bacterium]|nr:insulinase family protein [Myxococcales bacterium]
MTRTQATVVAGAVALGAAGLPACGPRNGTAGLPPAGGPAPGLRLVQQPAPSSPTVTLRVVFDAGSADDPEGFAGLTALAARLIAEGGTETLSYPELLRALFPMAAELGWQVDRDQTVFRGRVPAERLEEFYRTFLDVLVRPRLGADDFERLRAVARSELEDDLKVGDDEELGKEALHAFLYEGHPYGHPPLGTSAGLAAATVEQVRQHRARVFCAGRAVVGLAGGFPEGFAERVVADLSAGLPPCAEPRRPLPPPPPVEGRRVLIVDKPGNSASAISLGFPLDVVRGHPDFPLLALAVVRLGQHRQFVGRLMQEIREKRGFNYGDYAYAEHFVQDGGTRFPANNVARRQQMFSIWIRPVKPAEAHFVLRLALYELERFLRDGLSAGELEDTRAFALGYFNLYRQTEDRRLGYAIDDLFYGLDRPFLDDLLERWQSVTVEELNAAVRRTLTADDLKIAIVAPDGAALAEALAADAPSPVTYENPVADEILAVDAVVQALPLRIPRENIRIVPIADLFVR